MTQKILPDINALLKIDENYKAPDRIREIVLSKSESFKVFNDFLDAFNYDVSYDWFHQYFEDEHADRKKKKQDFTPDSISKLISSLLDPVSGYDLMYEPAAGTGGMIINHWYRCRMRESSFNYRPSDHFVIAEEVSDRTIPFLLFNLAIRGMNANVCQCDSLTRKCKAVYFVFNERDWHLEFSTVTEQPKNSKCAELFGVEFV